MFIVGNNDKELQYVDVEAARNGYYGYLDSITSYTNELDNFYIGDYVKFLKTGNGNPVQLKQSNWHITDFKQEMASHVLVFRTYTFTHTISGHSFRGRLVNQLPYPPFAPYRLSVGLITEDNPELYKELKENASWL